MPLSLSLCLLLSTYVFVSMFVCMSSFPRVQKGAAPELFKDEREFSGRQLPFIGFSFSRNFFTVATHGMHIKHQHRHHMLITCVSRGC